MCQQWQEEEEEEEESVNADEEEEAMVRGTGLIQDAPVVEAGEPLLIIINQSIKQAIINQSINQSKTQESRTQEATKKSKEERIYCGETQTNRRHE